MSQQVFQPFPQFFDRDGSPLDNGFIYVGLANQNPESNPVQVYYDEALTIPAAQPIRTINGYPSRNGSPARMWVTQDNFSMTVRAKNQTLVYTVSEQTGLSQLAIDLANGSAYLVDSAVVGFLQSGSNAVWRTAQSKMREYLSTDDFTSVAATMQEVYSGNKVYLNNQDEFEITVGNLGDVATINEAVEAAVRMRPVWKDGRSYCTIRLLSGFIMNEQLLIAGGTDLGWIKIIADDATVTINESAITANLSALDDLQPAFGARENSVLPTIGCQLEYADNTTSKDGVAVILGSKVGFMPETGVIRARNGLKVLYDSEAYCYMEGLTVGGDGTGAGTVTGVDFSYAANRGCHIAYGSRALLARSNFSYSGGDYGVYCLWASYGDLYQSNASHAAGTAFNARDGSFLNCRECNASYSNRGFHALHNGRINARSRLTGPTMIWIGDGAKGCSDYAVLASANSHIDADSLNCDECTGSAGVAASDASSINFFGGSAKDCTNRGVWAQRASMISAINADVSGCGDGFVAVNGSTISCPTANGQNCTTYGAIAQDASRIDADAANFSGCDRGVEAQDASVIGFRSGIAQNCTTRAVSAIDGGQINCQSANLSGAGQRGITSRAGGHVSANLANCTGVTGVGTFAAEVTTGGIIAFNGGTGTPLNVTPNTISANGIIFQ